MLIKINGLPWGGLKTPAPEFDPATIVTEFAKTVASGFQGNVDVAEIHRSIYIEHLDQLNYWIMNKTPVTDQVYKAACWSMDKILTVVGGG